MKARASATWAALCALGFQVALLIDIACNVALGLKAVLLAALTGSEQAACSANETLSAHAWRADQAGKPWARLLRPAIDVLFLWQKQVPEVNAAAGFAVTSHCERAFWKTRLRLNLDRAYRETRGTDPKP